MNDKVSISSQILFLEEEHNKLKKKYTELECILKNHKQKINKLKISLQLEKFKSAFFQEIIKKNTSIVIDDIYAENDSGILINNFPNGNIPVIVNELLGEHKNYNIETKIYKKKDKNIFRSVGNMVELKEEKPEELEEKVKHVDEEIEEIVQENNLDIPLKETLTDIENIFSEVDSNRIFKKQLSTLKEKRNKLLGKLGIEEYTKLVKNHIFRLETVFIKKKFDQKKITLNISYSLSSIDKRLAFFDKYYETDLETDDIQRFKICLKVNKNCSKRYIPFSLTDCTSGITNYCFCICSLRDIIKHIFINPYGFSNIVYLDLEKSLSEDPYSFYSLEKIDEDGKRYWKMECRLEDISKTICERLKNCSIIMFRKIYFDIYKDNIYRDDYMHKFSATRQDCEQLLINILGLCAYKKFCKMMRNTICKFSTLQPCKLDKFNLTRDDPISKKNFSLDHDNSKEWTEVILRLFDGISVKDAETIWNDRIE